MTIYYEASYTSRPPKAQTNTWKHLVQKKNWRIVRLPNGYYQTEFADVNNPKVFHPMTRRETLENAEEAIDATIAHFEKKLSYYEPEVVKTFDENQQEEK